MSRAALRLGFAAAVLAGAFSAARAQPVLHDIPWYERHDAARAVTLRMCRDDARLARLPDCENAKLAQNRVDARARSGAPASGSARTRWTGRTQTMSPPRRGCSNSKWKWTATCPARWCEDQSILKRPRAIGSTLHVKMRLRVASVPSSHPSSGRSSMPFDRARISP